ncbi:MAG: heme lyase CcmF/NrfE family subunit [Mitsuaria chitosanitabida]|uniref:heme lyase CcmF/NrfE family subunit n=1 Tax=Roseateles chitosanitabidus TaxID=65048 RepID=UPI001B2B56A0|nr:heme lyase CcmF/NrfE family subunit [Roseateles chitosanitabidus]MBO9689520.1 heme lyase CcmF/NrfE family subunit [Roseateles chitosanitabidus]
MIPEIGVFALVLALLVAVVQGTLPMMGAHWRIEPWIRVARPAALLQGALSLLAFAALAWSFLAGDFSVLYVAANSHSKLPAIYRFTAVWGGHEGSMLLWQTLLAGWGCAVALRSRALPADYAARVLAVMGWLGIGMLLFLLFLSNPFTRLSPAAPEGRDLNPLLQDPGMVAHPPLLYMGYVGFAVAFAFGLAALISGRLDATWARWSRPWTLAAWSFLTLGILLGSAWAYGVLGWGGWWFWDPVENASLMPWLAGTALIHSLIVTDRRGAFRSWTVLLAIAAFSLSLLGTFLVRSGVLTSVHAFAVDPGRGLYILCLMVAVVGGSLLLFAWRAPSVGLGGRFAALSRETLLLVNNVLFVAASLAVLLGTLYPLALDLLRGEKISVGPPYFEAVVIPLVVPALLLMGVGPLARWKRAPRPELARQLRWALGASALCAAALSVLAAWAVPAAPRGVSGWTPLASFGVVLAAWCVGSALAHAIERLGSSGDDEDGRIDRLWRRVGRQPASWWGMLVAHAGVGVFVLGATLATGFEHRREATLALGGSVDVAGLRFRLEALTPGEGPNHDRMRGTFVVDALDGDGGRSLGEVARVHPEKRVFHADGTALSQPAIDVGWRRDLFVVLAEPLGDGRWSVRVQVKPFMAWIWGGVALMALGGLLALADRRYRPARAGQAVEPRAASRDPRSHEPPLLEPAPTGLVRAMPRVHGTRPETS